MNGRLPIIEAIHRLNKEQQRAVQHIDGPLLIMAGAGSGKTRVITHRIAYLIAEHRVAPWSILAITFTNKASREMLDRVSKLVGPSATDIWVSTFHSMCVRILRRDIERIGFSSNFTILDASDQLSVIRNCMKDLNIDSKKIQDKVFQAMISKAKNELIHPHKYDQQASAYIEKYVAQVYTMYQRKLKLNNALDFDDLIMMTLDLFHLAPEVLDFYQSKFRYVHVDEYQDTNHAQYMLCKLISGKNKNICVVGDSDQSIYRWRGADISNILNFEKDYPHPMTVVLEQNYRSSKHILQAANDVISNNKNRIEKILRTDKATGSKIHMYQASSEIDEAYFVADTIRKNHHQGTSYDDHAILYRTNAQSRVLEERLIKSQIPYKIVGGVKFYDRKEIKDILAYLRLISNPADDISFNRIVNTPKRGIGDSTIDKLVQHANQKGVSVFDGLGSLDEIDISARTKRTLEQFNKLINQLQQMASFVSVTELTEKILEMTEYRLELQRDSSLESQARIENIDEFLSVTMEFEKRSEDPSLLSFLTDLALIADIDIADQAEEDQEQRKVILMTLHSAKGLEFPVVFIVGLEESIFPHARALTDDIELEEERRLAYVGITRAENQLFLSYAQMRTLYGRTNANPPSRFLTEISEHIVERIPNSGDTSFSARQPRGKSTSFGQSSLHGNPSTQASQSQVKPIESIGSQTGEKFKTGDKVSHTKWGVGTVIAMKGSGEQTELHIAFPAPTGIKRLLAKFAPIQKLS